jgi:hypothetical protein
MAAEISERNNTLEAIIYEINEINDRVEIET